MKHQALHEKWMQEINYKMQEILEISPSDGDVWP